MRPRGLEPLDIWYLQW